LSTSRVYALLAFEFADRWECVLWTHAAVCLNKWRKKWLKTLPEPGPGPGPEWVWVWAALAKTKPQMGIMSVRRRQSRKCSWALPVWDNAARIVSYY